jgi:ribosome maturation factor RimP
MTTVDIAAKVSALLEPEAEAHGFELVAVELSGGRGTPVIRVLLDRTDGVNLDTIGSASRWVSETLDTTDPMSGPYVLEVSSPGIDRPLVKRADYTRFAGEQVSIKYAREAKRASVTGTLMGLKDDHVVVESEGQSVRIPFEDIQKARLKGAVDFGKGRGQQ